MTNEKNRIGNTAYDIGTVGRVISGFIGLGLVVYTVIRTAQFTMVARKKPQRAVWNTISRTPLSRTRFFKQISQPNTVRSILVKSAPIGIPAAVVGGYMIYQGISGKSPVFQAIGIRQNQIDGTRGIDVISSISILKPRQEVFAFWRNFENLPRFMEHLYSVTKLDENGQRTHWVVKAPVRKTIEWDAEISEEQPDQLISWRSLPNAMVNNHGTVRFNDSIDGEGTVITVHLVYEPPAGVVGAAVAKLFGEEPSEQIRDDLQQLKQMIETGAAMNREYQPAGRYAQAQ